MKVQDIFISKWPVAIAGIVFVAVLVGIILWQSVQNQPARLPTNITSQIKNFQPYFFTADIPSGFTLKKDSVLYENDILQLQLHNPAKQQTVFVTQQLLPEEIAHRPYPNAEVVSGTDGRAIISYEGTRAMGALFSTKQGNAQTFVILTTADPVTKELIADMLRGLRPAKTN